MADCGKELVGSFLELYGVLQLSVSLSVSNALNLLILPFSRLEKKLNMEEVQYLLLLILYGLLSAVFHLPYPQP